MKTTKEIDERTKELLLKQLELLRERSEAPEFNELLDNFSDSMAHIATVLLTH